MLYDRIFGGYDYRHLMVASLVITLLAVPFVFNVPLGIEFTGGTEVQMLVDSPKPALESNLRECSSGFHLVSQRLGDKTSLIAKTKEIVDKSCVKQALLDSGFSEDEASKIVPSTFKPSLGKTLQDNGMRVILIALALMTIMIFIAFRTIVPSLAVIQAAVCDIIITVGLMSVFGVEMTLAGVAALMMLIGYSVDSDIMLTSRLLKQSGKTLDERINEAFITGLTMSGTTIGAMASVVIVSSTLNMAALTQISLVIFFGLVADFFTTWFMNVGILRFYLSNNTGAGSRKFKLGIFRT